MNYTYNITDKKKNILTLTLTLTLISLGGNSKRLIDETMGKK